LLAVVAAAQPLRIPCVAVLVVEVLVKLVEVMAQAKQVPQVFM
jgi:hypothetical protein